MSQVIAPVVFINYRNTDQERASHFDGFLSHEFGESHIFQAPRSLTGGEDVRSRILATVRSSSVVLCLIGKGWRNARAARGQDLDDPEDLLRQELAVAFTHGIPVVPVASRDAEPLVRDDLPEDLRPLADLHYLTWDPRDAHRGRHEVVDHLVKVAPELENVRRRQQAARAAATLVFGVAFLAGLGWSRRRR